MKRITAIAVQVGAKLRDRSRSVKFRILEIGRAARSKGGTGKEKLQQGYRKLLEATTRVVGQAKRFSREIAAGGKRSSGISKTATLAGAHDEGGTRGALFTQAMRAGIHSRSTKSAERKRQQKKRWFRDGQKWRTGCEGRISVVKRRHGLNRCRYKGDCGMQRWVGLGVISDNLINIGRVLATRAAG